MTEPVSSAIATNVTAALVGGTGVVIFGVHTGLDYATLIAGVVGGTTALSYREPSTQPETVAEMVFTVLRRACEVMTAALLAGYCAPGAASVLAAGIGKLPYIETQVQGESLKLPVSWTIAFLAHYVILPGIRAFGKVIAKRYSK